MQADPSTSGGSGAGARVLTPTARQDDLEPRLSVAAAARRLGIAPATLRTWDRRYGIGPTDHSPGRHRRYSSHDIARLELMQHALVRGVSPADAARYALTSHLPGRGVDGHGSASRQLRAADAQADAMADPAPNGGAPDARIRVGGNVLRLPGAGRRATGLGRAALALDASAVRGLLADAVAALGVEPAWDEVARPVLAAVAERWAHTGAGVEIEHLLSECVIGVFGARGGAAPDASDARPVLMAAMPDEQHTLPLVVLSAALAERGVPVRSLGANLPAEALRAAVRRTAPAAIVLWAQVADTADVDALRSLPRTRPRFRTFVAGPGWAARPLPPRTVRLDALGQAAAALADAVLV
ncbi:MerR family transcriptional regulator [Pseudonocardia nigra]|uniref:MerR family transcriptional regulator n=1 Tax=Pseudonocardia nigra TaxID=1921578 RepID=UPI0027E223CA|nr:MerR family transcriptional regulator [Pseudonocardia nigra]